MKRFLKTVEVKTKQEYQHASAHVERTFDTLDTHNERNISNEREVRVQKRLAELNAKLIKHNLAQNFVAAFSSLTILAKNISDLAASIRNRPKQTSLQTDAKADCIAMLKQQAEYEADFNRLFAETTVSISIEVELSLSTSAPAATSTVLFSAPASSTNPFDDGEYVNVSDENANELRSAVQSPKPAN